jgi:putative heme-binding domain-containing protein
MRTSSLFALIALYSLAHADEPLKQKPSVAPAVDFSVSPKTAPAAADAGWNEKFNGGPIPSWIWGDSINEDYTLTKKFDAIGTTQARLKVSADNHVVLYLNGKQVGASDEWSEPAEADVTKLLKEKNELVAEVRNDGGPAGLIFKLVMFDKETGKTSHIVSDATWTAVRKKNTKSVPAKVVAKYGDAPWGKVFDNAVSAGSSKVPANTFQVLPGFKVEKMFTVPKNEMGSWVSLTADDKGHLFASDQDSKGIYRITPGQVGTDEPTRVEKIPAKVTAAQGLLWAHGALYVMCNGGPGSGIYRVTSSRNSDVLDTVEKLKAIGGGGEHGPHALRLGPDGKSIYFICGNHTQAPKFEHSAVPKNWGEDHLLPRQWDANGHARGILAPGGFIAKTDLDGKTCEIITSGYRNPYDFAFNADGELFTYDADMEWDMGMPWYRPTRVVHATSGSEFGWRSGTGKWPAYYADSLPPLLDIGPGSPVGIEFGYGARFPAKYQKALFCCDWTFGTMYALILEPNGASYKATKEEFLSRTPLPLTDVVISPSDGAMYFVIGGRGAQSELFRVTYVGMESTAKVDYKSPPNGLREHRKNIEAFIVADPMGGDVYPPAVVDDVFADLHNSDRFVRYAARVALEHQPVKYWQDRVLSEKNPKAIIEGAIALARQGEKTLEPKLIETLGKLNITSLPESEQLGLMRAYQLVFIRMGEPDKESAAKVLSLLDPLFPQKSDFVNRELVQILIYLKSPTVVEKVTRLLQEPSKPLTQEGMEELLARNRGYGGTVANMLKNAPDLQKLHYAFVLRNATVGWTLERWKVYFGYLAEARTKAGGASFQGFINNMEKDAFANANDTDRLAIEASGLRKPYKPKELPKPLGPGREWSTQDVVALEGKLKSGRNFKNGERAYAAARCVICHRFGGDGGATGPDLSQVAGRFGLKDLAESIVEPSKVISDQYKASVVRTVSGNTYVGKIVNDANDKYTIVVDPEDSTKVVEVKKEDVESVKLSNISLMPEKLISPLNENEVLDMLAYLLSRGDPNHPMFKR